MTATWSWSISRSTAARRLGRRLHALHAKDHLAVQLRLGQGQRGAHAGQLLLTALGLGAGQRVDGAD